MFDSFFKKRAQEKQLRRPRRDGDDESVEDVDDDEFEKILGESRRLCFLPASWRAACSRRLRSKGAALFPHRFLRRRLVLHGPDSS